MPSPGVIDLGGNYFADSIGKFSEGFSDSLFKGLKKKDSDNVFDRIKKEAKEDPKGGSLLERVIESTELDEPYKESAIKNLKILADLEAKNELASAKRSDTDYKKDKAIKDRESKENQNKLNRDARAEQGDLNRKAKADQGMTKYQEENLIVQRARLANELNRIEIAAKKRDADLPKEIVNYSNASFKNSNDKLEAEDQGVLHEVMQENMSDYDMTMPEAFNNALEHVLRKKELVKEARIVNRPKGVGYLPTNWAPEKDVLEQSREGAIKQLLEFYDHPDVPIKSESDLIKIAENSGWTKEEAKEIVKDVLSQRGRKFGKKNLNKADKEKAERAEELAAYQSAQEEIDNAETDAAMWGD